MNGTDALARLRSERERRQQSELAEDIGVSEATVSRWLSAKSPPQRGLSRLVEWAERQPAPTPLPAVLRAAQQQTDANLTRLAEIQGYARAVWHMMQTVTDQQGDVVRALEPWGVLETAAISDDARAKAQTVAATLAAAIPPGAAAAGPPAPAARQKRQRG